MTNNERYPHHEPDKSDTVAEEQTLPLTSSDSEMDIATIKSEPSQIGSYRLLRELGRGGMGVVYLAERSDGAFKKKVAIKVIQGAVGPSEIARFRRERQILADLEHPNIARLLDGGVSDDGQQFVVMEYANGVSLRSLLKDRGALPVPTALKIAVQLCHALSAAHSQGIIHRDIKPENIVVLESGEQIQIKVLDFGIAKTVDPFDPSITQAGTILGTAAYMAPEMIRPDVPVRPPVDIYSTGLVLYEMLSGRRAFEGDSFVSILHKQATEQPASLRSIAPAVPPPVDKIVERAIEKDPNDRQASAEELARELENVSRALAHNNSVVTVPEKAPDNPQGRRSISLVAGIALFALAATFGVRYGREALSALGLLPSASATPTPDSRMLSNANTGVLMYRFLRVRGNERKFIPVDAVLAEGDRFLMEFQSPFSGALYLFYLDAREGSVIWANPNDDGSPQRVEANRWVASPRETGIALDDRPGRQVFRAVYVPEANKWKLRNFLDSPIALLGEEHKKYARLPANSARQLDGFLEGQSLELKFPETPAQELFKIEIALDDLQEKIFTHTIVRKQVGR